MQIIVFVHKWWWQKLHFWSHSVSLAGVFLWSGAIFKCYFLVLKSNTFPVVNENNLISHIDSWKVGYELQFCAGIGPFISAYKTHIQQGKWSFPTASSFWGLNPGSDIWKNQILAFANVGRLAEYLWSICLRMSISCTNSDLTVPGWGSGLPNHWCGVEGV